MIVGLDCNQMTIKASGIAVKTAIVNLSDVLC